MKKPTLIILALFCFSCGRSTEAEKETSFDFSYSVDTVMVDPDDGFIYLRRGLGLAALTPDKKQLFNFNPDASELEVIDLAQLKLVNRIKMEKEGPLGTGFPRLLTISDDGKIFFIGYVDFREFGPQLKNMKLYKIRQEKIEGLEEGEALGEEFQISKNGKLVFVPYGPDNFDEPKSGMAILSLDDLNVKKFPLELWQRTQDYLVSLYIDGNLQSRSFEPINIFPATEQVLISSHNYNEVYILDQGTDSITHKLFHSNLTADSKKVPSMTSFDSPDQMREAFSKANEEVDFSSFYYDDIKHKFFRFSRVLDRKIGDSAVFKQVITVFGDDLNQLHEEEFPIDYYGFKFFKDGKLYSYVNIEDELGFAVFTFDF